MDVVLHSPAAGAESPRLPRCDEVGRVWSPRKCPGACGWSPMTTLTRSDLPLTTDSFQPTSAAADQPQPPAARDVWRSEELLGIRTEVLIVHGSEVYRLRRTRQDKLILYK